MSQPFDTLEEAIQVLTKISRESSTASKVYLMKLCSSNEYLKTILKYTYDPYIVSHIGKEFFESFHKLKEGMDYVISTEDLFKKLIGHIDYLSSKTGASDEDKSKLFHILNKIAYDVNYEGNTSTCMKGMLLKDLKIGIGPKLINKAFPGLIPEFEVQLAEPFSKPTGECFVEPKLDGVRCIAIIDPAIESVKMYTRNGSEIQGYEDIRKELVMLSLPYLSAAGDFDKVVFDGEIMSKNFDSTMNDLFSKGKNKVATYTIFDTIPFNDFNLKKSGLKLRERRERLNEFFAHAQPLGYIKQIQFKIFSSMSLEQTVQICDDLIAEGYEGAMIKRSDSVYQFKRTKDWQKVKRFDTLDCEVLTSELGTGKYSMVLGALVVLVKSKKFPQGVEVRVGSGFSDKERYEIGRTICDEELRTMIAEVKYQEITKDGSLRFPVFVRFRPDKSIDDEESMEDSDEASL